MHGLHIQVPLALLRSADLTPAAKLIWLHCHRDEVHRRQQSHTPTNLARRTGLARSTVYRALEQLERAFWCIRRRDRARGKRRVQTRLPFKTSTACVVIPVDLFEWRESLSPQAIICYGFLRALAGPNGVGGQFKWADFRAETGLHLRTLKRAVRSLAEADWLAIEQRNRLAPIRYTFQHPDIVRMEGAKARLSTSPFKGQALMEEFLNVIIDTRKFHDGGSEGILLNPRTSHQLQLDRHYYQHGVVFEFNGRQHYESSEHFSKEQVAAQRERDAIKRSICGAEGVTLVVVHADDLSKNGIIRRIREAGVTLDGAGAPSPWLPLRRSLDMYRRTIRHLEYAGARYRRKAVSEWLTQHEAI